jgi:hypothetical protein
MFVCSEHWDRQLVLKLQSWSVNDMIGPQVESPSQCRHVFYFRCDGLAALRLPEVAQTIFRADLVLLPRGTTTLCQSAWQLRPDSSVFLDVSLALSFCFMVLNFSGQHSGCKAL